MVPRRHTTDSTRSQWQSPSSWASIGRLTIAGCRPSDRGLTPEDGISCSNCKLLFANNALVAVGLTLDAILERVSCYGEEANDREGLASGV